MVTASATEAGREPGARSLRLSAGFAHPGASATVCWGSVCAMVDPAQTRRKRLLPPLLEAMVVVLAADSWDRGWRVLEQAQELEVPQT
mmetsp:Transcript_25837/g.62472  ORF Transcript_25837/g.62472 Transcript_25837/m.62472 type:complete len:88 (+) Transcript_25837:1102-1365(+)